MEREVVLFLSVIGAVVFLYTPVIYKLNRRISELEKKVNRNG